MNSPSDNSNILEGDILLFHRAAAADAGVVSLPGVTSFLAAWLTDGTLLDGLTSDSEMAELHNLNQEQIILKGQLQKIVILD